MCSIQEKQRVDRELLSELIESPVNPAFLNMIQPLIGGFDPLFYLRINGEALWEWRRLKQQSQVFDALQFNLQKIGYMLSSCCRVRVGKAVFNRVEYITKKVSRISNGDVRRSIKVKYWACVALHPDEILQAPDEIIEKLKQKEEELITENQRLRNEIEGKMSLYSFSL